MASGNQSMARDWVRQRQERRVVVRSFGATKAEYHERSTGDISIFLTSATANRYLALGFESIIVFGDHWRF
ncbi:hypothetical protein Csa_013502 [Cucumis sativus]|uniref:Uncharacterized protein n=1 Tax=Cucumis sativus TaxID=3659 RepID=A0A0A0LP17_CUCSA|nr:hypothetical protein Csa_013502 [Cucumis sativus]